MKVAASQKLKILSSLSLSLTHSGCCRTLTAETKAGSMSRICVKNLPKHVAEDRLREFFSQKGEVTDAKLIRTSDGKTRQFAFIGYRTDREAEEAINYFNKSYLDTSKIICEFARNIGDPNIPRPWSRHTLKKEEKSTEHEKNVAGKNLSLVGSKGVVNYIKKGGENDDIQLQEFLQVMQPRAKSQLWANDTLTAASADQSGRHIKKQTQTKKEVRVKSVSVHDEIDKTNERESEVLDGHVAKTLGNLVHDEAISDMDYFKSKVKKKFSDSENGDDDDDGDGDNDALKNSIEDQDVLEFDPKRENDTLRQDVPKGAAEGGGPFEESNDETHHPRNPSSKWTDEKEAALEAGRLFVRNLPYAATEDELEKHFSKFGNVSEVHIVVDKDTKQSKGYAFVHYTLPESAARALDALDASIFQGRVLHIMAAKQKNPSETQEANISSDRALKTFKQQREEERKASEASGDTRAWNTLYINPDTVVENIARKFGVRKSDLLDREADNLAVRIALGETQVLAETKKALANSEVNIESLEEFSLGKSDGMKRSNHVLLVKNLPYDSSKGELVDMFGKFGILDKVILPPTKALAVVVFLEPAEALAAFKNLAYRCFKGALLYLEWAPGNILSQNMTPKNDEKSAVIVGEHDAKRAVLQQYLEVTTDAEIDPDKVESRSLFVTNLNFKTSEASLRKHFAEHMKEGSILSAKVIKKQLKIGKNVSTGFGFKELDSVETATKEQLKNGSMGFGFIELDSVETATNVLKDLQGTVLEGFALILELCHDKKDVKVQAKVEKGRSSTKLIAKNIPFQATHQDMRQLFEPFGKIKSLKMPKKFGNQKRGFGFVEFVSKQEADNALKALSSTHFYGRHLVLERAMSAESLTELRARTAAQFNDEQNWYQNSSKLSKKRKHMALDQGNLSLKQRIAA